MKRIGQRGWVQKPWWCGQGIIRVPHHFKQKASFTCSKHGKSKSPNEELTKWEGELLIWCFFGGKTCDAFKVHCFLGWLWGLSKRRVEKVESAKKDAILLHHNDCSKVYLEPKDHWPKKNLWDSKWIAQWQRQSLYYLSYLFLGIMILNV